MHQVILIERHGSTVDNISTGITMTCPAIAADSQILDALFILIRFAIYLFTSSF